MPMEKPIQLKPALKLRRYRPLAIGQVLWTRDGRVCGNALVTELWTTASGVRIYTLVTDFGNRLMLMQAEIQRLFHLAQLGREPRIQPLAQWHQARVRLTVRNCRKHAGILPVYSVHVVSPSLGLERKILVAAKTKTSVPGVVAADRAYRGWMVSVPDIAKLPARCIPFRRVRKGVLGVIA